MPRRVSFRGLSNRGIAEALGITDRTVEAHLTSAFLELGVTQEVHSNRRVLAALVHLGHAAAS